MAHSDEESYESWDWGQRLSRVEIESMLLRSRRSGILLLKTAKRGDFGTPGCWLGGMPTLPEDIEWPCVEWGRDFSVPMQFLAQINLTNMPIFPEYPEIPRVGTLYFFSDLLLAPINDLSQGSKVTYVESDVSTIEMRNMPTIPDTKNWEDYIRIDMKKIMTTNMDCWNIKFCIGEVFDSQKFNNNEFKGETVKQYSNFMRDTLSKFGNKHKSRPMTPHNMLCYPIEGSMFMDMLPLMVIYPDSDILPLCLMKAPLIFWMNRSDIERCNFDKIHVTEGVF